MVLPIVVSSAIITEGPAFARRLSLPQPVIVSETISALHFLLISGSKKEIKEEGEKEGGKGRSFAGGGNTRLSSPSLLLLPLLLSLMMIKRRTRGAAKTAE